LNSTIDELLLGNKEKLIVIEENKAKIQEINTSNKKKTDEINLLKENLNKLEQVQKKLISPEEHEKLKKNLANNETDLINLKKKVDDLQALLVEKDKKLNVH